jgi:hypothetical protein
MLTIGENENLLAIAYKIADSYTLDELLELLDIEKVELIYKMLADGLIDPEIVTEL